MRYVRSLVAGFLLLSAAPGAVANDSDASVGLGGVQWMREPRISMESERLTISLSRITVEYEFLNESDQDITTEVAFPIPPYEATEAAGGVRAFDDFKLWVDGKALQYQVESKAFLGRYDKKTQQADDKRDVTELLRRYKIDVPSLGHYLDEESKERKMPDFDRLSPADKKKIEELGLVEVTAEDFRPQWEVRKTYHWRQTFPAHKILHVRHEYTPGFGFRFLQPRVFDETESRRLLEEEKKTESTSAAEDARLLDASCMTPSVRKAIGAQITQDGALAWSNVPGDAVMGEWVDYILTTANSWKKPIKKFDLVIERGPKPSRQWSSNDWDYAGFCWNGPVRQVDAHRFEASAANFTPDRELKVLFVHLRSPQTPAAEGKKQADARFWPVAIGGLVGLLLCTWAGIRRLGAGRK